MTEETTAPLFILCVPGNEIAKIICNLLEQKGINFYLIPIGAHYAPPTIPDTTSTILIPLCQELLQTNPANLLCRWKQKGATLLPLGREDARALWAALIAGQEDSLAGVEVLQMEDPWDRRLFPSNESLFSLPNRITYTKINRSAPLLNKPLVDLNLSDTLPTFPAFDRAEGAMLAPVAAKPSRTLVRWLIILLFLSLITLLFALWKLLYPMVQKYRLIEPSVATADVSAQGNTQTPPDAPPPPEPPAEEQAPATEEPPPTAPSPPAEDPAPQQPSEPATTAPEPKDFSRPYTFDASALRSKEEAPPTRLPSGTEAPVVVVYEVPPELAKDDMPTSDAAGKDSPKQTAPPSAERKPRASRPQSSADNPPTDSHKENKQEKTSDKTDTAPSARVAPHYCPQLADLRKSAKGGNMHVYLKKNAQNGCPNCRKTLDLFLKYR